MRRAPGNQSEEREDVQTDTKVKSWGDPKGLSASDGHTTVNSEVGRLESCGDKPLAVHWWLGLVGRSVASLLG